MPTRTPTAKLLDPKEPAGPRDAAAWSSVSLPTIEAPPPRDAGDGGQETQSRDEPSSATTISGERPIYRPDSPSLCAPAERYLLRGPLGEGGMGEVLLCQDRRIGRQVAMKVVRPGHGDDEIRRARFLREARVQGQLEHPAIVPVYDLDTGPDGHAFFTMKRVRGETLEDILEALRRGDPSAQHEYTRHKLLSAFARACLAVDFAHAHGVLHRDLKPANLMLGRFGEVYVLDWGLAKRIEPAAESQISAGTDAFTAPGTVVGTPAYISPEQIEGRTDLVGPTSDVYALGAILFELLTLHVLHGTGSPNKMFMRALRGIDARPSMRAPERPVPPELEQICVRATARDPAARYASVRELADALEAHLSGDRDEALRRELAAAHLRRAREATSDGTSRALALREAGRAVALAPHDDAAVDVLLALLTEAPATPPPEVTREIEQTRIASSLDLRIMGALIYCGLGLVLGALAFAIGEAKPVVVLLSTSAWLVAAASSLLGARYVRRGFRAFPATTIASAVAIAATTLDFGVLALVPAMAVANAAGNMLTTPRTHRVFVVVMNVLAIVVPTGLAILGVHPTHQLGAGGSSPSGLVAVAIVSVAITILAAFCTARSRDQLAAGHLRNAIQTWQLRHLVPERPASEQTAEPAVER